MDIIFSVLGGAKKALAALDVASVGSTVIGAHLVLEWPARATPDFPQTVSGCKPLAPCSASTAVATLSKSQRLGTWGNVLLACKITTWLVQ